MEICIKPLTQTYFSSVNAPGGEVSQAQVSPSLGFCPVKSVQSMISIAELTGIVLGTFHFTCYNVLGNFVFTRLRTFAEYRLLYIGLVGYQNPSLFFNI